MKTHTVSTQRYFLTIICFLIFAISVTFAEGKELKPASTSQEKGSALKKAANPSIQKPGNNNLKKDSTAKAKESAVKPSVNSSAQKPGKADPKKKSETKTSVKTPDKKSKPPIKKNSRTEPRSNTSARKQNASLFQFSSSHWLDQKLQEKMTSYLGIPYRRGGKDTNGMDCSGFARTIYSSFFGIELPHNSAEQFSSPKLKKIDEDEMKTGDLVFFSQKKRINHVGIYIGDGSFIHATNGQGITITRMDDQHWKSRIVGSKRLMSFDKFKTDSFQLHGEFELPLSEGKRLKYYTRDEFRSSSAGLNNQRQPDVLRDTDVYSFDKGHLYSHEIEYSQRLWKDTWSINFSTTRERFDIASAWNIYNRSLNAEWPSYEYPRSSSAIRHGFKLASDISPFESFRITPSVVYLNYDSMTSRPATEMMEVPRRVFGLNTQITPFGPWSVTMALHYADKEDLTKSLFTSSDSFVSTDMSFKIGYYFSKFHELSFMGRHDFKTYPALTNSTSLKNDFILRFDMKY